ncbi:MAG: helix-turn-helix domain-containing protein [Ruminococcaceae bacterium]|nr:helix-turn-helix domain-containing protein [Oscillospiraceae bacterium]
MGESTVIRAIRELCQKGLLRVNKCFKENGRQTTNRYILVDEPQTTFPTEPPVESVDAPAVSTDAETIKGSPAKPQKPIHFFPCSPATFHVKLTPVELKIHHYLVYRTGKDLSCKPSKKNIAADCNVSLSTVFRAIRKLRICGLLEVQKLTRKETCGNNGTSVNLYRLKKPIIAPSLPQRHNWHVRLLLCALLSRVTSSLLSWVTPQRTMSRTKVTLKQRKEEFNSKLAVSIKVHIVPKRATLHQTPAKHHSSLNTG